MVGFSGILGIGQVEDKRQINRWKKVVNRFRGKLVKMIRNAGSKFDDNSISPKIRQILLRWGYELTEKDFELINKNKRLKRISYFFPLRCFLSLVSLC